MTRVAISVGGLWHTQVVTTGETTWADFGRHVRTVTGIPVEHQMLTPRGDGDAVCGFAEDDEVMCEWIVVDGMHPLHHAASDGLIEAVRSWVASGVDIDTVNEDGDTPLMLASGNFHAACVADMLHLGADVRRVNNDGSTPLHHVAERGADGVGDWQGVVRLLVAAGCDVMARDNHGYTAVMAATPLITFILDGREVGGNREWAAQFAGLVEMCVSP